MRSKDDSISEVRQHRRLKLLLRALLAISGTSLGDCFLSQQSLVKVQTFKTKMNNFFTAIL